jgi:hypothetical protein
VSAGRAESRRRGQVRNVDVVTEVGSWLGSFRVVPNISNFYCGVLETLLYCKVPLIDLRQLNLEGAGGETCAIRQRNQTAGGNDKGRHGSRACCQAEN